MSLVDRIAAIAKERRLTFKALERECGLGNGTIKRWEKQSPRLDGLLKVANYLQVPLDVLVSDSSETATSCDGVKLSQAETDLVAMFRILGERDRETAFDFVTMLYEKASGEKGSIYSTYIDDEKELKKSGPDEGCEARTGTA